MHKFKTKLVQFLKNKRVIFAGSLVVVLAAFQNCGKVRMNDTTLLSALSQSSLRSSDLQFREIIVPVEVNTPKTIDIINTQTFTGVVSMSNTSVLLNYTDAGGTVVLQSASAGNLTYTPTFGFRGSLSVMVYIKYDDYRQEAVRIIFEVQNPLRNFKPALIVRANECLFCHAVIKGDVITDMGFKSSWDVAGQDNFQLANPNDPTYGLAFSVGHTTSDMSEWGSGWMSVKIKGALVVPRVRFSELPTNQTRRWALPPGDAQTLAEYMDRRVFPDRATSTTHSVKSISEKSKIYIGTPTAQEIKNYGQLTNTEPLRFVKNETSAPELSGFARYQQGNKDYYTNTGDMVCEGDLFVDGVVWLKNLKLRTDEGCRIHATKTVFITGPIEYLDENALTNLQIMSAKAIYMGMGICIDCYAKFDSTSADERNQANGEYGSNWAQGRANTLNYWMRSLRWLPDATRYAETEFREDFLKVSNEGPIPARPSSDQINTTYYNTPLANAGVTLVDAGSRFLGGANVPFKRLMLNAPDVQSRYSGDFQGTIIAEFAMWKLGQFSFIYDPVFKAVPIFPLVDINKVIRIED